MCRNNRYYFEFGVRQNTLHSSTEATTALFQMPQLQKLCDDCCSLQTNRLNFLLEGIRALPFSTPHQDALPHESPAVQHCVDLKMQYQNQKTIQHKASILLDFQGQIEGTKTRSELDELVAKLKSSDDDKILETHQDTLSKIMGFQTSSISTLNEIIDAHQHYIDTLDNGSVLGI